MPARARAGKKKPATTTATATTTVDKKTGKVVKAGTSSTWQDEGSKKKGSGLKTRGDSSGGVGGWRGGEERKMEGKKEGVEKRERKSIVLERDIEDVVRIRRIELMRVIDKIGKKR